MKDFNRGKKRELGLRSPVAQHAGKSNKCAVHRDRKNSYSRKPKHRNKPE